MPREYTDSTGTMNRDYDDDAALTQYVLRNFRNLFSPTEELAAKAMEMKLRAAAYGDCAISSRLRMTVRELACEPGVAGLLAMPAADFWRHLREQVVARNPDLDLNRCGRCGRIPLTPQVRTCRWCSYSWRDGSSEAQQ